MSSRHATAGWGRIHRHQRNANFSGEILGNDIIIGEDDVQYIQNVEQHSIDIEVKKNYRNRIWHISKYWKENYPDYYAIGVRVLSFEEQIKFYSPIVCSNKIYCIKAPRNYKADELAVITAEDIVPDNHLVSIVVVHVQNNFSFLLLPASSKATYWSTIKIFKA